MGNKTRGPVRKVGQPFTGKTLSTTSVLHAVNALGITEVAFMAAYDGAPRGNHTGTLRPLSEEQTKAVNSYFETRDYNALIAFAGSTTAAQKLIGRAVASQS